MIKLKRSLLFYVKLISRNKKFVRFTWFLEEFEDLQELPRCTHIGLPTGKRSRSQKSRSSKRKEGSLLNVCLDGLSPIVFSVLVGMIMFWKGMQTADSQQTSKMPRSAEVFSMDRYKRWCQYLLDRIVQKHGQILLWFWMGVKIKTACKFYAR